MIQKKHLTLNRKEFDMLPKKIYLNYVNENDVDKTWSEEPISASDCEMNNREYTDLSQVWHDASEEPLFNKWILTLNEWHICKTIIRRDKRFSWRKYARKMELKRWTYVSDLIPK